VTITLGLDGSGKVDIVAGGYADWEARRSEAAGGGSKKKAAAKPAAVEAPKQKTRLTYIDQRDYDGLPKQIEQLEAAIARDEELLADPDLYTGNPTKFAALNKAIDAARVERDKAEERWMMLAEKAEGLG
jgi:ATP-binding cassette subfamily F protein uup